ncbi:uncharacterized protein LOC109922132 [Rhincodon typus]|uniref:uncharacterized protein LOC109922132 n=1 Tax=Rhincodon typus TaxID=259920 RepID=UPI00202EE6BC|nr:uncharacterized protein LOC109922132 [Rhincodon typus]
MIRPWGNKGVMEPEITTDSFTSLRQTLPMYCKQNEKLFHVKTNLLAQRKVHHRTYLLLFVSAIMICLLIIQALPCITMKRKQQREKTAHKGVHFAPSRSTYTTSGLNKSVWFSAFSHFHARGSDHLFARTQTLVKGQSTTLSVLSLPRLSLSSVLPMELIAATEYLFPQTEAEPKDKSFSSLNSQGDSAQCSFMVPSASWSIVEPQLKSPASVSPNVQSSIPPSSLNFSHDCQIDQRLKSPCVSTERRLSRESNTDCSGYPEKDSVSHCLVSPHTPRSEMEPTSNPGSSSVSDSNLLCTCLENSTIEEKKPLPSPHHLAQGLGMWSPGIRESQPFHQTSNFWSCLQDKSPKPNSSLKGLTSQNGEVRLTTLKTKVAIASTGQPKRSTRAYSAGLRLTTRTSEQNRLHPKAMDDDDSCTISHLTSLVRPEVNVSKDYCVNQTPSLTSVPRHCQNPRLLSAPSPPMSNLEWKSEPSFATPNHMRSTKCDDFVEIPLDEIFPPNSKTFPERKAWSGISEQLLELWTKILPSIFDCFHIPVMDKLRAPVEKNLTTVSNNTLNVRVESEAPGSGTGLDAGHVWGKILKVSRSNHEPLPWGKAVADLLFQEIFKPTEILKGDQSISTRGTEWDGQLPARKTSMTCKDQDRAKETIPVNKEMLMSIPGQSNRPQQFIQTFRSQSSPPWAVTQSSLK